MPIRFKMIILLSLAAASTAPALAADPSSTLGGHAPISCEAALDTRVIGLGAGVYELGNIQQFCNAPFELRLSHGALPVNSSLIVEGRSIVAGDAATLIAASGPRAGLLQIALASDSEEKATQFAHSMMVSINATGF